MNKREMKKSIHIADVIEAMHIVMMWMYDKRAYDEWVQVVPDEPTEKDFWDVVSDEGLRTLAVDTFMDAIRKYGKDGIYWG